MESPLPRRRLSLKPGCRGDGRELHTLETIPAPRGWVSLTVALRAGGPRPPLVGLNRGREAAPAGRQQSLTGRGGAGMQGRVPCSPSREEGFLNHTASQPWGEGLGAGLPCTSTPTLSQHETLEIAFLSEPPFPHRQATMWENRWVPSLPQRQHLGAGPQAQLGMGETKARCSPGSPPQGMWTGWKRTPGNTCAGCSHFLAQDGHVGPWRRRELPAPTPRRPGPIRLSLVLFEPTFRPLDGEGVLGGRDGTTKGVSWGGSGRGAVRSRGYPIAVNAPFPIKLSLTSMERNIYMYELITMLRTRS